MLGVNKVIIQRNMRPSYIHVYVIQVITRAAIGGVISKAFLLEFLILNILKKNSPYAAFHVHSKKSNQKRKINLTLQQKYFPKYQLYFLQPRGACLAYAKY